MKQYKHVRSGRVAMSTEECDYRFFEGGEYLRIPAWMIETSADWIPVNPVLLVTEDGVEIRDERQVYGLGKPFNESNQWGILDLTVRKNDKLAHEYYWFFSTAAARDEYVLMNKPVLSVKEVLTWWSDKLYHFPGQREEALKQLAKSKL
jgi:hypothetical protein